MDGPDDVCVERKGRLEKVTGGLFEGEAVLHVMGGLGGAPASHGQTLRRPADPERARTAHRAPPKLKKSVEPEESPQEAVAGIVAVEPEQIASITNEQPGSDGVSAAGDDS